MTSIVVWGFLLRLGQVTLEASLTLLVGVVVAGVLRRMVSPAGTRRLFGRGLTGLLRGWLAGMLLPVCSLGVIPVAGELRRAGVPGGTVLAFTLTA
ncbi:MAG: permease, partial [Gemmataceae bacterium]|nr:permease [Gemmataceae bacterium]